MAENLPPRLTSPSPPPNDDEESFSAWPLVITIGTVKLITLLAVLIYAWGTSSAILVLATIAPWVGVVAALAAAPVAWQWRKRRVRRKRALLLQSEFMNSDSKIAAGREIIPSES